MIHIPGEWNPADILTKILPHAKAYPILKELIFNYPASDQDEGSIKMVTSQVNKTRRKINSLFKSEVRLEEKAVEERDNNYFEIQSFQGHILVPTEVMTSAETDMRCPSDVCILVMPGHQIT